MAIKRVSVAEPKNTLPALLHEAESGLYGELQPGSYLDTRVTDYQNRVSTMVWDYAKGNLTSATGPSAGRSRTCGSNSTGCRPAIPPRPTTTTSRASHRSPG